MPIVFAFSVACISIIHLISWISTVLINEVSKSLKLSIESENALVKVTYRLYNLFEVYLGVGKPAI